ncbi:hypothetical protein [Rhizobium sp. 1399]|uniref:hypothetical protein n=1 Tax=Rhizobium sp. 1399 TaxID=2817758 RepID=UPI00285B975F|nr:hypothetical protein [Rhizobium sp. 1399]MDR6664284.1 putative transcriptional regulator [Rhizobium sp. 1399]
MSEQREKNDIAIAQKALCLAHGLTNAERMVAGAIISHFNVRTQQCDPGIDRLATMLALDEKTVRRATNSLCEVHGLFMKDSHGGYSGRARYVPIWSKFRAIVSDWEHRMVTGSAPSGEDNRSRMSGIEEERPDIPVQTTGHLKPKQPGKNVRQTHYKNSDIELMSLSRPVEFASDRVGLSKSEQAGSDQKKRSLADPATTGYPERRMDWKTASAAVNASINSLPPDLRAQAWAFLADLGEGDGLNRAIRAELKCAGAGLREIQRRMTRHRLDVVAASSAGLH